MSVNNEANAVSVMAEADSVVTEVKKEQVQPSPQTSILCTIMHTLLKVARVLLCLWLSTPLWLPLTKTALGWATQYLQYITAFALVAAALTHISYSLLIPIIRAWVVHCTSSISLGPYT